MAAISLGAATTGLVSLGVALSRVTLRKRRCDEAAFSLGAAVTGLVSLGVVVSRGPLPCRLRSLLLVFSAARAPRPSLG